MLDPFKSALSLAHLHCTKNEEILNGKFHFLCIIDEISLQHSNSASSLRIIINLNSMHKTLELLFAFPIVFWVFFRSFKHIFADL